MTFSDERKKEQAIRMSITMKKWREEHPEEFRKQQSHDLSGKKNGMYGKGYLLKGRQFSEEHKLHISQSKKGTQCGENNPFYGKHHTTQTMQKFRQRGKKVFVYDAYTNILLWKFFNIKAASEFLSIDRRQIDKRYDVDNATYYIKDLNLTVLFKSNLINDNEVIT